MQRLHPEYMATVARFIRERRYGRVLEVRSLFLHSSDLDPAKLEAFFSAVAQADERAAA